MKSIAIIPARGGSKRIPRKNIKEFCGKPIIAYSIEAAIKSEIFDEIIVSTDCEEIKEISLQYNASVPFMRSSENSNDTASSSDVIVEVIDNYEKMNKTFDTVMCLYPTAPFITEKKIKKAFDIFVESKASTMVSVVKYSFPPQRSFSIKNEKIKINCPQYIESRSQDLEDIYHDAGQLYFADVQYYKINKRFYSENTVPFVLNEMEVQDIDTFTDWSIAELKYKYMQETRNRN